MSFVGIFNSPFCDNLLLSGSSTPPPEPPVYPVDEDGPAFVARTSGIDDEDAFLSFILDIKNENGLPMEEGGLSEAFDFFYRFLNAGSEANAKLNIPANTFPLVKTGSPTFASSGVTGAGSGAYLSNGYFPNTHHVAFKLDSAVIISVRSTDNTTASELDGGIWDDAAGVTCYFGSRYNGFSVSNINAPGNNPEAGTAVATAVGVNGVKRIGNTLYTWKDGEMLEEDVIAPTGFSTFEYRVLGISYISGGVGSVIRNITGEMEAHLLGDGMRINMAHFNWRYGLMKLGTVTTPKPLLGTIFTDSFSGSSLSNYNNNGGFVSNNGFEVTATKGLFIAHLGQYFTLYAAYDISTGEITFRNTDGTTVLSTSSDTSIPSDGDDIEFQLQCHKGLFIARVYINGTLSLMHQYDFGITYPQANYRPGDSTICIGVIPSGSDWSDTLERKNYRTSLDKSTTKVRYTAASSGTTFGSLFEFSSIAQKECDFLMIGDSNTFDSFCGYKENSIFERLALTRSANRYGGPGLKIEDINYTEAGSLCNSSTTIVILIGTNNSYLGDSDATVVSKTRTLYNGVAAAAPGATIWVCIIPPLNTVDNTGLVPLMEAEFPGQTIDLNTPNLGVGFQFDAAKSDDGIHFNKATQYDQSELIRTPIGF